MDWFRRLWALPDAGYGPVVEPPKEVSMKTKLGIGQIVKALLGRPVDMGFSSRFRGFWDVRCYTPDGNLKWRDPFENLVVNEGLDDILDVYLSGGTQDTTWFVGLLASSPSPAASWTATEIASNDFVAYDESNLQAFTDGGVSSQSVDNSGSPATFTISSDGSTIGGAFLIGTNAKGTPSGTLYAAGAFSGGDKSADDGDTLEVTCTFTSADDGA